MIVASMVERVERLSAEADPWDLDVEVLGIPPAYFEKHDALIGGVTRAEANEATRARISPRDLTIVAVATADDVAPAFEALPGVRSLRIVPFDEA